MGISGFKKRGLQVLLVAVVLFLLIAITVVAVVGNAGGREVPPVTEPSFSLNGEDYPLSPVLQDFIDRGWKLGKSTEQIGNYVEGEGPADLVTTGYLLSSGENVESFCLDGQELAQVDSSHIIELLGNPDKVDEKEHGVIYRYSMPEKSIYEITFTFLYTLDTVAQIFIVFE